LTVSELGKAELQSKLADKRVTEIAYLAENGKPEKIAEITESLNSHLSKITLLVSSPEALSTLAIEPAGERAVAPTTPTVPTTPAAPTFAPPVPTPAAVPPQSQEIKPEQAPEAAALKGKSAVQEPRSSENKTKGESDTEGKEGSSKSERRAKLKTTVEDSGKDNIARLRSLLETAPESSKTALRRTIESSEREYQKTVEALDD
jgi:outer membrane biosynthesis protein TonB